MDHRSTPVTHTPIGGTHATREPMQHTPIITPSTCLRHDHPRPPNITIITTITVINPFDPRTHGNVQRPSTVSHNFAHTSRMAAASGRRRNSRMCAPHPNAECPNSLTARSPVSRGTRGTGPASCRRHPPHLTQSTHTTDGYTDTSESTHVMRRKHVLSSLRSTHSHEHTHMSTPRHIHKHTRAHTHTRNAHTHTHTSRRH